MATVKISKNIEQIIKAAQKQKFIKTTPARSHHALEEPKKEHINDITAHISNLCLTPLTDKTPQEFQELLQSPNLIDLEDLLVHLEGYVSDDSVEEMRQDALNTLKTLRESFSNYPQISITETPPQISPSSLGDFEPSEEYKTKLYADMPKLWANAYTRALILLHIAETDRDAFAALRPQQDDISFTPETIDAAFENTQNPSHHQYVLAATLTLILEGDLPALGKFVDPTEEQQQKIRERMDTFNKRQPKGSPHITINTTTSHTGEQNIPPLDDRYKVNPEKIEEIYRPYFVALQVLRSDPSKTLTDKEIEEIVEKKPNLKPEVLQVLAPIARNKDAWDENDELQQRPLTNRLRQSDIAGFISYACMLLGLESPKNQEDYAKVVAQQMGYEVGHTFEENDLRFVQSGHQQAFETFRNASNILWQGGAVPNFTQTTLATLKPMLPPEKWDEIASLYSTGTIQQYLANPKPAKLGSTYSELIWHQIGVLQESNILKPEEVANLCKQTVYREGAIEH
jgi:hypothetical protein